MNLVTKSAVLLSLLSMVGCASTQPTYQATDADVLVEENLASAAQQIQLSQAELYQAGMMSRQGLTRPVRVTSDLQKVTVSWNGDAKQLLNKLASDRGLDFYMTGVEQPLPVVIDVEEKPYDEVLQMVQAQVGYRANLIQDLSSLSLRFQRPGNPVGQ